MENIILKSEIKNLQKEISKSFMKADDGLNAYLIKIVQLSNLVVQFKQIRSVPFHKIFLRGTT